MYRILVVDDDDNCREVLSDALTDDYSLFEAKDGLEAVRLALEIQPDLILLDIMMSGQDGLMALQEIRQIESLKHVPVIMLTAVDTECVTADCLESGADDFITKPFSNRVLRARIASALRKNHDRTKKGGVISVVGVKGGTGTTTVAVNLAALLASSGQLTGFTELTTGMGTAASLLGMPATSLQFQEGEGTTHRKTIKHITGLHLLTHSGSESPCRWDSSTAYDDIMYCRRFSYLVLDIPRCQSPAQEATLCMSDRVLIVAEPKRSQIPLMQTTVDQIQSLGVSDSMITLVLVERTPLQQESVVQDIKQTFETIFQVCHIPHDEEICEESALHGVPLVCTDVGHPIADALTQLSRTLIMEPAPVLFSN